MNPLSKLYLKILKFIHILYFYKDFFGTKTLDNQVGYWIICMWSPLTSLRVSSLITSLLSSPNFLRLWIIDLAEGSKASLCDKKIGFLLDMFVVNHAKVVLLAHKNGHKLLFQTDFQVHVYLNYFPFLQQYLFYVFNKLHMTIFKRISRI